MEAEHKLRSGNYPTVEGFVTARHHEFPALHPKRPPAPVEGNGRLVDIYDYYRPPGVGGHNVHVMALRIERRFPPNLVAYLDMPVNEELLEYLRSLARDDRVTVAGLGHGPERHVLCMYPVHRINGRLLL